MPPIVYAAGGPPGKGLNLNVGAMRIHDWTGFAALGAGVLALVEVFRGHGAWALGWLLAYAALAGLTRWLAVRYPSPMPHMLRWSLLVPRGNQSPGHLRGVLEPRDGERILEIGPGIGIHTVPMAQALAPAGTLDVLDVQQDMLDDVTRRAEAAGVTNITAQLGDAQELPYPDGVFDAAYLLGVLGEIPDEQAALRELRRVLKPTGRLVIGEVLFDPDCVLFGSLKKRTAQASFAFERRLGGFFSYLARFKPA